MNKVLKITIAVVLCLIVILAVVLLVSQCSNNKTPEESSSSTTTPPPACTSHVDANTDYLCDNCGAELEKPSCTEHVDANHDLICDNEGCTAVVSDKIYVITTELNLRKHPNETGVATVSAKMDDELTRIAYYTEGEYAGWSKVLYNGEEYYVATDKVTTKKPITEFTGEPTTVYFIKNAYAYTKPSYLTGYSEQIDLFFKSESVKRTGVATVEYVDEDGAYTFARIEYTVTENGVESTRVSYVNNAYLSTEKPSADGTVTFESNNEVLVSKLDEFWLRKSTVYQDSEKAKKIYKGTTLQAIGFGIESDQTNWYKVLYEGEVYYVIYKETYFDKYTKIGNIFGEYSITLPTGFAITNSTDKECAISNGGVAINIVNTGALPEGTTAQYFAETMIQAMQLTGVEAQENDGVVYFEFETSATVGNQTSTAYCLVVFTAGSNNNFYVTTLAAEGTKTDASATLWGYVDSIEISSAE